MKNYFLLLLGISLLFFSCQDGDDCFYELGESTPLGNGEAVVWYHECGGVPQEVGITLTAGALEGLPPMMDMSNPFAYWYILDYPASLLETTPFRYMQLDWNPMGHVGPGYHAPHFDFHFYMMPNEERLAIPAYEVDSSGFLNNPPAGYIPADYIKAPGGVEKMGCHWIDQYAPELNGQPFTKTFLYGSFDGEVIFYEPMITRETLLNVTDEMYGMPIKQPDFVQYPNKYYPTTYNIYTTSDGSVHISISDFVWWGDNLVAN